MLCATNCGQYERACYMPSADHDLRPEKGGFIPRADQDESLQCSGVGREFVMFGWTWDGLVFILSAFGPGNDPEC